MKSKLLIVLILIIIFGAVGILFRHGDKVLNQKATRGFVVVGFETIDSNLSNLDFFINNSEPQKRTFTVEYYMDDQLSHTEKVEIPSGGKSSVATPNEVKKEIESLRSGEHKALVRVIWNKDKNVEEITKRLETKKAQKGFFIDL